MSQFVIVILVLIAAVAALNGVATFPELTRVAVDAKATVFQQISARLDVGLSLLVFAVSIGMAALIQSVNEIGARRLRPAPPTAENTTDAQPQMSRGEAKKRRVAKFLGVDIPPDDAPIVDEKGESSPPQLTASNTSLSR